VLILKDVDAASWHFAISTVSRKGADPAELDRALEKAHHDLDLEPDLVPDEWVSYAVRPYSVEFWQGDPGRRHQRLRYARTDGDAWSHATLWP
jgi:pyridoxamine 5'-phosphate oxidase